MVTATYAYTAFGDLYGAATPDTPYLYTGQQYDAVTGLYSLRARYYDPAVGRFLSRDTYQTYLYNPVELNRYGYVGNNPSNFFDPMGYTSTGYGLLNFKSVFTVAFALYTGAALYYVYAYWVQVYDPSVWDYIRTSDDSDDDAEVDYPDSTTTSSDYNHEKAIKSLEKLLEEHEQKLSDYKKDPWAFDNQGLLENAPTEEIRQKIIDGRIQALETQITGIKKRIQQHKDQLK